MKSLLILATIISIHFCSAAQKKSKEYNEKELRTLAVNACRCIDSIKITDKTDEEVITAINKCIGLRVNTVVSPDTNNDSSEYKKFYYEFEKYLKINCIPLRNKILSYDKKLNKTFSTNLAAVDLYNKGLQESEIKHYEKAVSSLEKAVKLDSNFIFAWDNLGINYKRLNKFDKAIEAYEKSLAINPNGLTPLQNVAILYEDKKEYSKALYAYNNYVALDTTNAEVYYGIGLLHVNEFNDYEKGLTNICKAYNLFVQQESAYSTDLESFIKELYARMKKQGKKDKFIAILKENNIPIEM